MTTTTSPDLFDLGYVAKGVSAGWDLNLGYNMTNVSEVVTFTNKAAAAKMAREIGWDASSVQLCNSRFMTKFYALHAIGGGFLTASGLRFFRTQAPAEHRTETWERSEGERYVTKSNGSCGRWMKLCTYGWRCTCGDVAIAGATREEARRAARQHREAAA